MVFGLSRIAALCMVSGSVVLGQSTVPVSVDVGPMVGRDLTLNTLSDRISYAIGYDLGEQLKMSLPGYAPTASLVMRGLTDSCGRAATFTPEQLKIIQDALHAALAEHEQPAKDALLPAKEAAAQALQANLRQGAVQATASGLQYRIIAQGEGVCPKEDSRLLVAYWVRLMNGSVVDSSDLRGGPVVVVLNEVMPVLMEGLGLLREGGVGEFWVPPELAFGKNGAPEHGVPPFAVLHFKVEVLKID